jgi:hypothetical protein
MCQHLMLNCHFNVYHNKQHILYIVMDETKKCISHMCHELQFYGLKMNYKVYYWKLIYKVE